MSIPFPLPETAEGLKNLMPLSTQVVGEGKVLLPKPLFDEVIGKIDYTDDVNKLMHKSGVRLIGTRSDLRVRGNDTLRPKGPFDFGDYGKWYVTAMRYGPCIDIAGLQAKGKAALRVFEQVDTEACVAQLRLTAQPLFRAGDDASSLTIRGEFDAGGNNLVAKDRSPEGITSGDYAIHLAFSLDHQQSKKVAEELRKFKSDYGDVTAGMPLGVHPCLWRAARGQAAHSAAFGFLQKLSSSYASNLSVVAFMGIDLNLDPWVFFNGFVVDGKYKHVPITAVRIPEGQPIPTSARTGRPLPLGFNNGWYQMLTFVMAQGREDTVGGLAGQPVVPLALPDTVNDEISTYIRSDNQLGIQDLNPALANMMRVVNPHKNSIFTTDCVSCHRSSGLIEAVLDPLGDEWRQESEKQAIVDAHRNAVTGSDAFPWRPGYTSLAALNVRQFNRYNVMSFAWFSGAPSVSHRAVYESVDAAHLANVSHIGLQPRDEKYDLLQVEVCMYTNTGGVF